MLEKVQQCTEAGVNISALWIQGIFLFFFIIYYHEIKLINFG